jgi:uncharacterized membrane protein
VKKETKLRSMVKAIGYRIISFLGTSLILWLWSKKEIESFIYAFIISMGAIFIYYIYERIWLRISWGIEE